jgi:hypothetical protein
MNFKIDTREKFTIITPDSDFSSDNLTAEFKELMNSFLQHNINIVMNLKNVVKAKEKSVIELAALQQKFYEHNLSFVICELQDDIISVIKKSELEDVMNITPTETEAWDIVQMEEVERELLKDEE